MDRSIQPWLRPTYARDAAHARLPRHGFTLIELLVVIAIIALLVALLVPAISAAREASRRSHCTNNLHQMGVGLHEYHGARGSFPPGGIEQRTSLNGFTGRQLAWSALLLPYIEEQNVYDLLDLSTAFDSSQNAAGAATVLPVYLCPTAPRDTYLIAGRAVCDYGGIYGERLGWTGRPASDRPNKPPKGAMLYDRAISLRMITDGAANTLILAENPASPDGQWINGLNIFDQGYAINQPYKTSPTMVTSLSLVDYEDEIRSQHPGGANGLFADGSVRFLDESLDLKTLAAICTRARGDIVGSLDNH